MAVGEGRRVYFRRQRWFWIIFLGLAGLMVNPLAARANGPEAIRVGLVVKQPEATVGADGPHALVEVSTGRQIAVAQEAGQWRLTAGEKGILVPGVPESPEAVRVVPLLKEAAPALVTVNGVRYRGEVEVRPAGSGTLTVVNVLPLEQYLYGVVPREMPAEWPVEALKAQAVAARTYALNRVLGGARQFQGFDVLATPDSQVYGGVDAEDPRSTAAVDATRGEVLTYNGKPILALFHSSSGGHTENSEYVFESSLPYLRGVPDEFDGDSPHHSWTRDIGLDEIASALDRAGYRVGTLYGVESIKPLGVSGRHRFLVARGSTGSLPIKANAFRLALGLKSTLFEMNPREAGYRMVTRSYQPGDRVAVMGRAGMVTTRPPGQLVVKRGSGAGSLPSPVVAAGWQLVPAGIRFNGRGWGHGVGMAQWGARAMARSGYNYRQILQYYYQGAVLEPPGSG